jgi:hypothetical protein
VPAHFGPRVSSALDKASNDLYALVQNEVTAMEISTRPFDVYERPFSIDPTTKLMSPDGIFDACRGEQLVGIYYTALAFHLPAWDFEYKLTNISFTFEVSSDSGINIPLDNPDQGPLHGAQWHAFNTEFLKPGKQYLRFFKADFSQSQPDKYTVRFKAFAVGIARVSPSLPWEPMFFAVPDWDIERHVFVAKTSPNKANRTVDVTCPEGTLRLHNNSVHLFPFLPAGHDLRDWPAFVLERIYDPIEQVLTNKAFPVHPPLMLPDKFTLEVLPDKPFSGLHGDLPFADPLWKIAGWIGASVFFGLTGGAVYVTYRGDEPEWKDEYINYGCDDFLPYPDSTYPRNCGPGMVFEYEKGFSKELVRTASTAANLFAGLGSVGVAVGLMDEIDSFRSGETHTQPKTEEKTTKEVVKIRFEYVGNPIPGELYRIRNHWLFERHTDAGNVYTHRETWETDNNYVHTSVRLNKDIFTLGDVVDDVIELSATFRDKQGKQLKGNEIYAVALMIAPNGSEVFESIHDNAGNGVYTLSIAISTIQMMVRDHQYRETEGGLVPHSGPLQNSEVLGRWHICVIAQSVNLARQSERCEKVGGQILSKVLDAHLWKDCKIKLKVDASFVVKWVVG